MLIISKKALRGILKYVEKYDPQRGSNAIPVGYLTALIYKSGDDFAQTGVMGNFWKEKKAPNTEFNIFFLTENKKNQLERASPAKRSDKENNSIKKNGETLD